MHQGGARRHLQERQFRRDDRVDRPNLGLLREYKPHDGGVLARRPVRRPRRALFPADRPLDRHGRGGRLGMPRQERVFEEFRAIFNNQENVHKEAYFDKMTHFDFKCLSARPAAGRGPDEHGAWAGKPRAAARSSADRIPRHVSGRCEIRGRPHEAPAEARLRRCAADRDRRAARQDGLPGAAQGMVLGVELRDLVQDTFRSRNAREPGRS